MELQETRSVVERCFRGEAASCECACPFHLEIRAILKKMARGRWPAAYRDLSQALLFPAVVGALCPQPCRERCQRVTRGDEPLAMAALERACAAFNAAAPAEGFQIPPKSQRVAVVGAGPAGLACALVLARKKYGVTVFDSAPGWGGHLRDHPEFPLFEADFRKQFAAQSVDFRFAAAAEAAELEGFDAVYVATGDGGEDFGLRAGWDPADFTTEKPGWFLGGGVCGMPLMESIAAAQQLSQLIEAYLMTGRAALIVASDSAKCEGHMMDHPGVPSAPLIAPADPTAGYTKDEAKAEAARCMQCVCDRCFAQCEMMAQYNKTPEQLAAAISGDSHTTPPFSNCTATRQTYSCNLCGACARVCPEGVDLGELFRMSREDRWKQGKWVPGLFDYWLRALDLNDGDAFYAESGQHEYLFFPGCQLSAILPEQVMRSLKFLRSKADVGVVLGCCGAPAVWAGDLDRRQRNLGKLRTAWEEMGRPTVVAACATCADMLRRQIDGVTVVSLYEKLAEWNAPTAELPFAEAALFDPCSAQADPEMHSAVLALAEKSGCRTEELSDGGSCCGYGGLIRLANPELYGKVAAKRAAESEKPYIVYCANCLEVFRREGKTAEHVLAAVFGGETALPSLREKRRNALALKARIMEEAEGKVADTEARPWDAGEYVFPPEVLAGMEEKLISEDDIREDIWRAEREQSYFVDETGLRTACLQREVLTFWADYRRTGEERYEIAGAYCHRMHLGGGADT